MRFIATLLFLALLVLSVWTFVEAPKYGWWLPPNVSSYGGDIDYLFFLILWMVAFFLVLTEGLLVYCIWVYGAKRDTKSTYTHGSHKLELLWTAVPAVLLLFIAFSQMGAWAHIKSADETDHALPLAEVYASQFDWRFRYPGDDGKFGTMDDIESPFEFVVPVDEKVVFHLRSRDVIHSFFVPYFRLKQDAMPGMMIPVWFKAEKAGTYDLICAELCGWGHYKMAGRVRVVSRAEYQQWLDNAKREMFSNGQEDNS
ncbi:MAG: cytochrome c oxidase subunit II [Planctomycetota bacterium]